MRKHYYLDPRVMSARWNSPCSRCGQTIHKGDRIIFWPAAKSGKMVFHYSCGEKDFKAFLSAACDETGTPYAG